MHIGQHSQDVYSSQPFKLKLFNFSQALRIAEISAIRKACEKLNNFSLKGCELYTSAECCPMCMAAVYWARIDKVYYVNTREDAKAINFDDSHIYEELKKNINERKIPMIQIKTMKEQAIKAFEMWSKSGNTKY